MENCYDFCFHLGKGKFTKYFIDLQVHEMMNVQKKIICFYSWKCLLFINKNVLWSVVYIFWIALSTHCKITYLQLKIQFWLKVMTAILTDMTEIFFFGMTIKVNEGANSCWNKKICHKVSQFKWFGNVMLFSGGWTYTLTNTLCKIFTTYFLAKEEQMLGLFDPYLY